MHERIGDDEPLNVLMLDASEVVPEERKPGYYIVRAGDTACEIAEQHSVSCKSLFKLNKLDKRGKIYRGQRLKLPVKVARTSKTKTLQAGKWTVNQSMASQTQPVDTSMPRYFYTHANFYAITQYNHSVLYAMAVYDLSVAIAQAKLAFDQQQPNHSSSAIQ